MARGVADEDESRLAKWMGVRFTCRVRRVGGVKGRRPALGFTIPTVVCEDLNLKVGETVKVTIQLVEKAERKNREGPASRGS